MKVVSTQAVLKLVRQVGLKPFLAHLVETLEEDFSRWERFRKAPRHVTAYPAGVIELMPCADDRLYACKYVNGHPGNTRRGRLSVIALGLLAEVETGYPLMLCEMTFCTALRTAATAALSARYLARSHLDCLALIGTGAQAEFQVLALSTVLPLRSVRYFDIDPAAMTKFARNLAGEGLELVPCAGIGEAIGGAGMIVTATADRSKNRLLNRDMVAPGVHIHAMGGDSAGKTELDPDLLRCCKVVVEYLEQSRDEGEIQNVDPGLVHAELWELVSGRRPGRENDQELTLFDSVGFALEDFSVLRLLHRLTDEWGLGADLDLIPAPRDPKDLYGLLAHTERRSTHR